MTTSQKRNRQERALARLEANLANPDHVFGKAVHHQTYSEEDGGLVIEYNEDADDLGRQRAEQDLANLKRNLGVTPA